MYKCTSTLCSNLCLFVCWIEEYTRIPDVLASGLVWKLVAVMKEMGCRRGLIRYMAWLYTTCDFCGTGGISNYLVKLVKLIKQFVASRDLERHSDEICDSCCFVSYACL